MYEYIVNKCSYLQAFCKKIPGIRSLCLVISLRNIFKSSNICEQYKVKNLVKSWF
jgi:hypothetical protein